MKHLRDKYGGTDEEACVGCGDLVFNGAFHRVIGFYDPMAKKERKNVGKWLPLPLQKVAVSALPELKVLLQNMISPLGAYEFAGGTVDVVEGTALKDKLLLGTMDIDTAIVSRRALATCILESPLFIPLLKWVDDRVATKADVLKFRESLAILNDMKQNDKVQEVRLRWKTFIQS